METRCLYFSAVTWPFPNRWNSDQSGLSLVLLERGIEEEEYGKWRKGPWQPVFGFAPG